METLDGNAEGSEDGKDEAGENETARQSPEPGTPIAKHNDQRGNDEADNSGKRKRHKPDETLANWTIAVAVFTGVLAAASVFGDVFSYLTLRGINGQLKEMHESGVQADQIIEIQKTQAEITNKQLAAMRDQAISANRSSTANRAWIFVKYRVPQLPTYSNSGVEIAVDIENAGNSPAVITGIETKIITSNNQMMVDEERIRDPENVTSGNDIAVLRPFSAVGSEGDSTFLWMFGGAPTRQYIIGSHTVLQSVKIVYFSEKKKISEIHGSWFYFKINYRDIYGLEHHTRYYVGLYGAGTEYGGDPKYNSWD